MSNSLFPDMPKAKRKMPQVPENTKPYRPSNGTEGEGFKHEFCYQCKKFSKTKGCPIEHKTMVYDVDDKDYPKWWVADLDGDNARCLLFAKR